ncbi:RagB/SusD family nutrient uptake outer membrane protein [Rhodocytophaga rosea]|uniref:RagB/SusD family nutrient uptake outer membrane protein n=1 Tax=Rhodocytophaga rosea TaxID=2704465 RepID=A0A6C0GMQ1_9BACT|nr:RagB/SusD family nutrient uptake outer membrane protein [Rhodocytophaga rosea]QHT68882.1 RagB/SusD family nutrient uptake outer membrane protein [Rhodocytophaga rosea]
MKFNIVKIAGNVFLCGAMLLGTACNDFLEETPPSNLTPDNFYTIPDQAEAAIAAVYADTRFIGNGAGIFSVTWQMLEAPTGTSTTETAQNSDLNNLYSLSYDGNTQHIINWWNGLYRVIANANIVIDRVPGITPMNDAQKARIIGEAQFLRAWAYFYVVRLWGDAPLITKPQTIESPDFLPSRNSQEEIYQLIVDDLVAAEAAGLAWMNSNGRVSQAAVKSLLAKVYLTMAGQPLNKGASHYKLAADKAAEVITYANANPGTINLFPTYGDVHLEAKKNTVEHIFMLQYNILVAGNPMQDMHPNFKPVTFAGNAGTGSTVPTRSFYNSYEAGDLRAKDREGYFYTSYFRNGNGDPFDLGAPYIFKHFNVTANGTSGVAGTRNNNLNVPLIRYAEVLLMYAEAQNELGGPTQEAYDAFKRIRDRAQLTTPELGTYDQNSFREAIWRERWHEFCYEFITWFDMVRLRKVYNETTQGFDNFVGHVNIGSNQALQEKHLLFPIPRPEMQNNANLKPQNPGYPQQ